MALVKYTAGLAAIIALAAGAPTAAPQVVGGIQNEVVNVVKTDTDIDVVNRHGAFVNFDPDPKHIYFDGHWKREAAPGVINGINNNNFVDIDSSRDFYKGGYKKKGGYYKREASPEPAVINGINNNDFIDIDSNRGFYKGGYKKGGYWKREASPEPAVINGINNNAFIDVDTSRGHYKGYYKGGHWKREAAPEPAVINGINNNNFVDIDSNYKGGYYHKGHWYKRSEATEAFKADFPVVGGIQNEVINIIYDNKDYDFKDYDWFRTNDPDYLHHRYYLNDGDPKHHYYYAGRWF